MNDLEVVGYFVIIASFTKPDFLGENKKGRARCCPFSAFSDRKETLNFRDLSPGSRFNKFTKSVTYCLP